MQAFISYKYDNTTSEVLAANLNAFLKSLNITSIDGKEIYASEPLIEQIEENIKASDFLIVIYLKEFPNTFINQEIGFAKGSHIPVILITDDPSAGSLIAHQYKLHIEHDGLRNATELVRAINRIRVASKLPISLLVSHVDNKHRNRIVSELFEFDWFTLEKSKKNYCYHIVLEEHPDEDLKDRFYLANFHIHFESTLLDAEVVIETTRTDDNFHPIYDRLVRNPKSVYRYILKTEEKVMLDNLFNIKKITIDKLELEVNRRKGSSLEPEHVQFSCSHEHLAELVGSRVDFEITIETIVDKRRNEFTVLFGYPVENLETQLVHLDSDINKVDIVDMLTAKSQTIKSRIFGKKNIYGAKASYSGWIFPNSGITYIWNRPN
jgi:hypothetical protein